MFPPLAACWGAGFAMLTGLGLGILPGPALLEEKRPDLRQIWGRCCPHTAMATLVTTL